MKPLTKVAPGLLVIQIQIQAVWLDNVKSWKVILKYSVSDMENRKKTIGKNVFNNLFNLFGLLTQINNISGGPVTNAMIVRVEL